MFPPRAANETGAALMRALRVPVTIATSFAGSAVALYTTLLVLQFSSIAISLGSLACGLIIIAGIGLVVGQRRAAETDDLPPAALADQPHRIFGVGVGERLTPFFSLGVWTPFYAVFWAIVGWRCVHEPLAGPDIEFRWSFLAEQMLRFGSLDFYPPRSAADFFSYFWVESIPPGTAALHGWAYACAGGARAGWTVPAVMLQIWSLHELVWRTAQRIGGTRSARFACLAAAASPLLTWSVLLGQETGLTALSLIGIVFALQVWRETRVPRWAFIAGTFATLGAAAREYGLVFPGLAVAALMMYRADRRAWLAFVGAAVIGLAWPLRVWALTGNPFYSLQIGGFFPINERFVAWIQHDAKALGAPLHTMSGWRDIARYLVLFAPTALIGWVALAVAAARGQRHAALALGFVVVVLALWVTSVPFTNGGLFYSMRVLSPALALGTLATGVTVAALVSTRPHSALAVTSTVAVPIVMLASLAATLVLPRNPWRTPWREWLGVARETTASVPQSDETVTIVLKAAAIPSHSAKTASSVVLADAPGFQRRFLASGVRVIPLWSPQANWLFDRTLSPAETVRQWRESGVRHLILTKWKVNLEFLNQHSRWSRPPFHLQLVGETSFTAIFAINAAE